MNTKNMCKIFVFVLIFMQNNVLGLQPFVSVFGEQEIGSRYDDVSVQFQYGVSSYEVTSVIAGTGTVTSSNSMATLQTGVGSTGSARIDSVNYVMYRPGHETYAFFTARFASAGAANSTQWIGLLANEDGIAVGFNALNFSVLFRSNSVDTPVAQASFNIDTLDGTGPSGFVLDPTKINVFRIAYGWLGAAQITVYVLSSQGVWIPFQQFQLPNTVSFPSLTNPILPIRAQVTNVGNTSNLILQTGSWNGGSLTQPNNSGSRYFTLSSQTKVLPAPGTELVMYMLRNKTTYQARPNRILVHIAQVNATTSGAVANDSVMIRLYKNATVGGTAFVDVNAADSVMEVSANGLYAPGTGFPVYSFPRMALANFCLPEFSNFNNITITLNPGESLTVTGESISNLAENVFVILSWQELF